MKARKAMKEHLEQSLQLWPKNKRVERTKEKRAIKR
jgi:hypothetical protein